jgi:hypothetical protein
MRGNTRWQEGTASDRGTEAQQCAAHRAVAMPTGCTGIYGNSLFAVNQNVPSVIDKEEEPGDRDTRNCVAMHLSLLMRVALLLQSPRRLSEQFGHRERIAGHTSPALCTMHLHCASRVMHSGPVRALEGRGSVLGRREAVSCAPGRQCLPGEYRFSYVNAGVGTMVDIPTGDQIGLTELWREQILVPLLTF